MQPSLCVLIPVFNNQGGLARTLRSLAASPTPMEVLVVDDGSHPPVWIGPGMAGLHKIVVTRLEKNGGITLALNHGLRVAYEGAYRYIGRVDAGDTVQADRFEKQVSALESDSACGLVGSYIDFVDMNGKSIFIFQAPEAHPQIVRRMHLENCIIHSGVTMRASVVQEASGYREKCLASEDYDLFRRMILISKARVLPEILTRCEYNLEGISILRRGRQQRRRLKLQVKYFNALEWMSYFGIARTCFAMIVPHGAVLAWKRAWASQRGAAH